MSHERVLKTLANLGLSHADAEVYIHLAAEGPERAENIADALKLQKNFVFQILESLQAKGVVSSTLEQTNLFFALPFHEALELLVKKYLKEVLEMEQSKSEILSKWQKIVEDSKN